MLVELLALFLDAVHHHVPDHLLSGASGGGIRLENLPATYRAMHVGAVQVLVAGLLLQVCGNGGLEVRAHGCGEIVQYETAQTGNKPLPCPRVAIPVQGQGVGDRLCHGFPPRVVTSDCCGFGRKMQSEYNLAPCLRPYAQ